MSVARLAASVFVVVHVAALAAPCPSAPPELLAAMDHRAHGHVMGGDSDPTGLVQIDARCPCGCDERGVASLSSARLGFGEIALLPSAAIALSWMPLAESPTLLPGAPRSGIDPVPI